MTVTITHSTPADSSFSTTGAAAWNADHTLTGVGTMAEQNANNVAITGGAIDGTTIGGTTPAAGTFTTLTANSTSQFGKGSANYLQAVGASSGSGPVVSSQGSDTNIDIIFSSKGASRSTFQGNGGTHFSVNASAVASAVNFFEALGTAAGVGPVIRAEGSDTNINGRFRSKGTGSLIFETSASNNTQLQVANTASAVNYVQVTGGITGGGPIVSAKGSDANISLLLQSKGASHIIPQTDGSVYFQNLSSQNQFRIFSTASAVNYLQTGGSVAGAALAIQAAGSDTNIPLVLQPKGTGALQAQQTDSTATGGNARGANAVDWQMQRDIASRVASGQLTAIGGGYGNTANGIQAAISGGTFNTVSGTYNFVGGGFTNTATQLSSAIAGGAYNSASGIYNFIGGGFTNSGTASAAVTTQSGTMNGTTAVTLSGSNASIKVGQYVSGTSIATETYVAAISGTSLTLSKVASGSSTSTLSFYTPHGIVVGGGNNQATGSYSFIGGGGDAGTAANRNVASGDWSVVGGGRQNTASGASAFVGGGGVFSAAAANNYPNTASGSASFVGGGLSNTAGQSYASVLGGVGNTANGIGSTAFGIQATTRSITGYIAYSSCDGAVSFSQGVSQGGILTLGRQTTDATATVLTSNSGAASTQNQVILPNNSAYYFKGTVVAGVTGGGNTKGWTIEGVIKRGANAASTTVVGVTVNSAYADVGATTWMIAATADTTNGGLAITATGQAATTIRWVCKIETTEMTY